MAASNATWRIEMNCTFPGPTATRCCSCFFSNWTTTFPHTRFQILSAAAIDKSARGGSGDRRACFALKNEMQKKEVVDAVCVDEPTCEATKTTVLPGRDAVLSCRMAFSGVGHPPMKWFAGDGEELDSQDYSKPGKVQYNVTRSVTIDDDRRPFRCVTRLDNKEHVCQVELLVPRESLCLLCLRQF